jgi:hypothetical protein
MPRSPFQGSYQPGVRPTIVTAPDALVYINGETDILGCQKCRRRLDWNKYITSIQVDLNVDSAPGSASINMSVPRHSIDEFYFDGQPLISPMMEVEIFAKGYYLVEGVPQYYPIFWGLVTDVSDDYSSGEHTFSVNCSDILKWWELCKMNINPAFVGSGKTQQGRSIFGNTFFGTNPYDVIWTLAQQAFGDIVVGSGSLTSLYKENSQKETFMTGLADLMAYWSQRFSKIRSNLLLYGTSGNAVRGDVINSAYSRAGGATEKKGFASQMVRQANGGPDGGQMVFDPTDPQVVAFRTQFQQAGQVNFWQSEYQTKLELANAAKESIGYEFFMDVTGDIVFKPPFYNLDVLSNKPISWIQDIDIIDWNFSESEAEVVTQLSIQGSFGGNVDYGMSEEVTPFTSVTDYHLLRKYGWRSQTFNSEFLGDPMLMFYVGLDKLDRFNCKRFKGSVSIPMRPELRLGFPIYVAPKDQVWYIQGISHNIQFGSRAQTTLSLTAKRQKFVAPKGIGTLELTGYGGFTTEQITSGIGTQQFVNDKRSGRQISSKATFKATIGAAAELPPLNIPDKPGVDNPYEPLILRHPKTGRIVGYPNVVMAYTRPLTPSPEELRKAAGEKTANAKRAAQQQERFKNLDKAVTNAAPQIQQDLDNRVKHTFTDKDGLREKHLANKYSYGLNSAGVYTYLRDEAQVIKEILLMPAANIDFGKNFIEGKNPQRTGMIRPVSDERGFEVIGHYRYGRGLSLKDGSLILNETAKNPKATNTKAEVSTQIALAGGMYEMLQAQSAGLGTVNTMYPNPADAVARLSPDPDLQTAATVNPQTKEPEFINADTTFVDVAPLGSPEQKGAFDSVEASQLSRALTLAEMSAKTDNNVENEECGCIFGRPDLAFISVGYQVSVLRATTHDTTSFGTGAGSAAALATVQDKAAKGQSIDIDAASVSLLTEALSKNSPVSGAAFAVDRGTLVSRVDTFLTTLYSALDVSHQEYEAALRGETLEAQTGGGLDPINARFPANQAPDTFAPPFSVPGRAVGGDPAALAKQGSTAIDGISKSWEEFGDKLRSHANRTELEGKINNDKATIASLRTEQERLQTAKASGTVIVGPGGSVDTQLKRVSENLSKAEADLANNQHTLNNLNQQFPP